MSRPEAQILTWVVQEGLQPLRETDPREQMDRENLHKLQAEASQTELKLAKQLEPVADVAYLKSSLF